MLGENIITSIVNTLLHSLWQAPLIAILLYISIAGLKLKSKAKYALSFLSLFIILAVSISTFIYFSGYQNKISSNLSTSQASTLTGLSDHKEEISSIEQGLIFIEKYSEMIFVFWLSGMLIFLIKFGIDLYYANSIRKKEYCEVNEIFLYRCRSIAERMGVTRSIKFLESNLIKVPVVIGHIKPVILLPLGLVTKIPNDQIEAIISHELAHIIRNDFLHNLIQSVIEIIYFFNPAIYWISKQIRTERENCCDDLAMKHCSDSVNLAKGLYNLQKMQIDVPKPMMAAVNNGDLLSRIKRIIGKENNMTRSYTGFIASVIVIFLAATIFTGCTLFAGAKDEIKTEEANVIIVKKSSDGEDIKMDVFVTDGGDEDMEKQIFITTTDDGKIIKKVIKTEKNGDEKEMKVEVIVTNDDDKEHDVDIDIDVDFRYELKDVAEALEKALEEIESKDLNEEQRQKVKAKVKKVLDELKFKENELEDKIRATVKKKTRERGASKSSKMIITKNGVKKEILIDKNNMKEFTEQMKELDKDIIIDIQVLDDYNDAIIISDSDDHNKKIEKIIIKKDKDSDLSNIKMIEKIDISNLREELVKDGILKEKSEDLKIFIDDDIIKINDKEIPAEHKDKYKKLLGGF